MEELGAFVGGVLLLALALSLGLGAIVAVGWFLLVVVLPIVVTFAVAYFSYKAAKSHLARQGRDISELLPSLPRWAAAPAELRQTTAVGTSFLAGLFGLALPGIISASGTALNVIAVVATLLFFWWAIPLAVHNLLNSPRIKDEIRFPALAFLACFAFSLAGHINTFVFLFLTLLAAGYGWWWYEHHPYPKMRAAYARCKDLHATAQLISVDDFLTKFRSQYVAKWGFEPSPAISEAAEMMYRADAIREIPPLPELPRFQVTYAPGQDITAALRELETSLTAMPAKTQQLIDGITMALNAYTEAVPPPKEKSVFTVAAQELIDDLPRLVQILGTCFPQGFYTRTIYEDNRDAVSREGLGPKAYESGQRIEPEAFANA